MITRSRGIHVPGWAGSLPGGGYEGKTKALDNAVARFAKRLERRFCAPVEIRFNSDQRRGGAWIVDAPRHNAGLGLNAGLGCDGKIYFSAYISADLLEGQEWGSGQDGKYAYFVFRTADAAWNAMRRHLRRDAYRLRRTR